MNRLILWMMAVLLISCTEKPKGFDSKIFTEKEVSDFIRLNPQWDDPAKEAEITEKFKHKMINLSNDPNFLTDFPLQLKAILDTTVSGQDIKLAIFKDFKDETRPKESLLNQLELEIRGMMSVDQVSGLNIDQKYTLQGIVYKQGKRGDVKFINQESPIYALGRYTFWNMKVKPLK